MAALDAGVPLRDVQVATRHADPRTTTIYDRRRQDFDRHAESGARPGAGSDQPTGAQRHPHRGRLHLGLGGGQQGCLSPFIFWHLYQDGVFRGSLAPWIGQVFQPFGLTPGTTYRFQVQAQHNCTGAVSPLSEPLVVTTPAA